MGPTHAAFFRNLNLGHPGSPTRERLEAAFLAVGATHVRSFQTNGTVAFSPSVPAGPRRARSVAQSARDLLNDVGYDDAVLVCSLRELRAVLAVEVEKPDGREHLETLTFHDRALTLEVPWTSPRDDLDVLARRPRVVIGRARRIGTTTGSPTVLVERLGAGPATTRTRGTVERLLRAVDHA